MPLVFEASSIQHALIWFFSWTIVFRFQPENKKYILNWIDKFKGLYLLKFQALFWSKATICLEKFPAKALWKPRCYKCKICCMLFPATIAVEQEVIVAAVTIAVFIFARFWYTPTRVQSKPSRDFALRHRLPKQVFYNMYVHIGRGSCNQPIHERLIGVCSC